MEELPDVHNEQPKYLLRIGRVGIKGIKLPPVKINGSWTIPYVSVLVDLPEYRRGIHVSRLYKTVYEVFNSFGRIDYEFLDAVATRLLGVHEDSSRVDIRATAQVVEDNGVEFNTSKSISMRLVKSKAGEKELYSSVSFIVVTTCPCALSVSEYLYSKPYTHNSKMYVVVTLKSAKAVPTPIELMEFYDKMFTAPRNYLNRASEAEFIKKLVETPRFAEDITREIAHLTLEKYSDVLGEDGTISVYTKSVEPLHEYYISVNLVLRVKDFVVG